ncbi:hypothetical protein OO307_27735, partial [Pseudomonas sp. DCB_E]|nr:hypothetical protein [Pseudomonas sp. DCB_E]
GSTVSVTIENATGGNFEQLTPNPTPAQTTINDSVDTTTATLTASPSVTEGGVITYTVTLSNPAQTPVTVTLSNGQTISDGVGDLAAFGHRRGRGQLGHDFVEGVGHLNRSVAAQLQVLEGVTVYIHSGRDAQTDLASVLIDVIALRVVSVRRAGFA